LAMTLQVLSLPSGVCHLSQTQTTCVKPPAASSFKNCSNVVQP
jgi:hypothetical protein